MPPHCDALDGPVVRAAQRALDGEDVMFVLPYVPAEAEAEVEDAFGLTMKARAEGPETRQVADRWFFETVVRCHRAGEGAPYTGLKPAGLSTGPVIPVAERAIADEDVAPLIALLTQIVGDEARARFELMLSAKAHAREGLPQERHYVSARLGLQVWAHELVRCAHREPHAEFR